MNNTGLNQLNNFGAATGSMQKIGKTGWQSQIFNQFTPEQLGLFKQMFSSVDPGSFTSKLASGDQSAFNQLEAPQWRDFKALQGNLASRFSGAGGYGSLGARKSSGFQNTMTSAGSQFAQDLAANRQQLQRQATSDLFAMSQALLGLSPYRQDFFQPQDKKTPTWMKLLGLASPVAGAGIGGLFGGPTGAYIGGSIGSQFLNGLR